MSKQYEATIRELRERLTAAEGVASMRVGLRREIAEALGVPPMAAGDDELRAGLAKIRALMRVASAAHVDLTWQRADTRHALAEALHDLLRRTRK